MRRFQAIIPGLPHLLWVFLALLVLAVLCSVGLAWKPGGAKVIQERRGEAQVSFAADRTFTVWPFNCVKVSWSAERIRKIFLNGESTVGSGEKVICSDTPPTFRVTFTDRTAKKYTLDRFALSQAHVMTSLILPLIITGALAVGFRRRLPATIWLLAGFAIPYMLFFVNPIFLEPVQMRFPQYVPTFPITGFDLRQTLDYSADWLNHGSPYLTDNNYPPLTAPLFAPILLLPFHTAYQMITAVTLACFAAISIFFPMAVGGRRSLSVVVCLLFVTGIMSYGFQFELERGQFNVIVMFLCLAAIYLFHFHPKLRYVAYALFVLSVQMKLYPLIFIIFFVEDWSLWKENIRRFAGIVALNIGCFFVLGLGSFNKFLDASLHVTNQDYPLVWPGSGSITTFALLLPGFGLAFPGSETILQVLLYAIFAGCFGVVWWRVYKRKTAGIDPYLLMICSLGAMVIPSLSNDYKLPLLVPPMIILLEANEQPLPEDSRLWLWNNVLALVLSAAYAFTLFSYVTKVGLFTNNLPALMVMLVASALLAVMPRAAPADGLPDRQAAATVQAA